QPPEPHGGQSQKQLSTCHQPIVGWTQIHTAPHGRRQHEREVTRETPREIGLLSRPYEGAEDGHALALLPHKHAAVTFPYPARRIIGHGGEDRDLVPSTSELACQRRQT